MALDVKKKIEVEALAGVVDDLDYYQLLRLKAGAPIPMVEKAYVAQSQEFHPDRFFGIRDPKFMKQVTMVFKKITEAYQVLKDPELKKMYDGKLGLRDDAAVSGAGAVAGAGGRRHVGKDALEAERAAGEGDSPVKDKKARKYWDLAQIAASGEDWNGVVMNIQFAMSYEKDNPVLKGMLEDAKVRMKDKAAKGKNPYKIKIV